MSEAIDVSGQQVCRHEGCAVPAVWVGKAGPRCLPHVPMVDARAELGVMQVRVARITCSACGHAAQTAEQALVKAIADMEEVKGRCPGCGIGHSVTRPLVVQANAMPNRHARRVNGRGP